MSRHLLTPRLRPLPNRRSTLLSVLDVGTSKVVCLIAKLLPAEASDTLRGRTHRCKILGIGHQRARGIKSGVVIDMEEAEKTIRLAVDAAERMAGVEVESVIVNMTGGRITSQHHASSMSVGGRAVSATDLARCLDLANTENARDGRALLHSLPTGYTLDGTRGIRDPKGMIGDELSANLHNVSVEAAAARNLMLAIERCHLSVEAIVATPYAAGLAVLVDDEADMGAAIVDMGGGTTSVAIFNEGRLTHLDAIAVGGNHVTMDIARGLTTRITDAERLKIVYGSCVSSPSDVRETIAVTTAGEDGEQATHMPKTQLVRIIRPRVEEILELVRDRLKASGFAAQAGRRLILTGGGSQLNGMTDLARATISGSVRIGRALGVQGLPESAKSPAYSAAVGLLIYPQVAGIEHFASGGQALTKSTGTDGYVARVGRWLKESF
jgi:cell division protein FtsA